ncbi:MAG: ABC transporter ATP-binding protein [Erysipelotrichaceae bacterium]|nr:ABC transporter ATP-binding protein [Erysipelotrichaceae bacterium]
MASSQVYENSDRKMSDFELIKKIWKFIAPYKFKLLLSLFFMAVMILFDLITPLITEEILRSLTIVRDEAGVILAPIDIARVFIISGIYFIAILGSSLLVYINSMLLQRIGQSAIYDLRMVVFQHIDSLSVNQLNNIPVGSLVTRLTSDTNALCDLFTNTIVNMIRNILMLVGVIIVMFLKNWLLALTIFAFVPIIFVATMIFRKHMRENYRIVRKNFSIMNAFLNENISGMKITQIFNQEDRKENEFKELNNNIISSRKQSIKIFSIYRPFISFLNFTAVGVVFAVGMYLVFEVKNPVLALDFPAVYAMYLYISKLFQPVQALADSFNGLQRAFTSSERLYNLLETEPEVLDREDAIEMDHFEGRIEFKNVWFAYKDENWILKDVSFTIEPKQVVAFVGATGAGKTTILQLIVRNYEIQKGEILIDGVNVNNIKIESLRRNIGQMLQDVFLFSGSIRSNINLRDDDIKEEDIVEACAYVNADSFINKLPNGLDEEVNEGGNNFSSGQRQLLSFARTVVHKPQILILDEATANIDTETEQVIQNSLEKMMNIGTMLIVAHRLSTIQHSDNIICLQKGEIIEQGNHQDLLKKRGYYYNLYRLQYEDQETK